MQLVRAFQASGAPLRLTDPLSGLLMSELLELDPEAGMIVSANDAAVDASYPHFIGNEWDPG